MSTSWLHRRKTEDPSGGLTQRDQRLVWRIAALLLDYPARQTVDLLDDLSAAAVTLPAPAGPALVAFVDTLPKPVEVLPESPTQRAAAVHGKDLSDGRARRGHRRQRGHTRRRRRNGPAEKHLVDVFPAQGR